MSSRPTTEQNQFPLVRLLIGGIRIKKRQSNG
jgi:hypothetical protein